MDMFDATLLRIIDELAPGVTQDMVMRHFAAVMPLDYWGKKERHFVASVMLAAWLIQVMQADDITAKKPGVVSPHPRTEQYLREIQASVGRWTEGREVAGAIGSFLSASRNKRRENPLLPHFRELAKNYADIRRSLRLQETLADIVMAASGARISKDRVGQKYFAIFQQLLTSLGPFQLCLIGPCLAADHGRFGPSIAQESLNAMLNLCESPERLERSNRLIIAKMADELAGRLNGSGAIITRRVGKIRQALRPQRRPPDGKDQFRAAM